MMERELRFSAPEDIDLADPKLDKILAGLHSFGIRPLFELPEHIPSYEALAVRSPITSPASYLGIEHFRTLGHDMQKRVSSRLFSVVVEPYTQPAWNEMRWRSQRRIVRNQGLRTLYTRLDIQITSREEAGLLPIPPHLERTPAQPVDKSAIQADSVVAIARHAETFSPLVDSFGEGMSAKLQLIAERIQDTYTE